MCQWYRNVNLRHDQLAQDLRPSLHDASPNPQPTAARVAKRRLAGSEVVALVAAQVAGLVELAVVVQLAQVAAVAQVAVVAQ